MYDILLSFCRRQSQAHYVEIIFAASKFSKRTLGSSGERYYINPIKNEYINNKRLVKAEYSEIFFFCYWVRDTINYNFSEVQQPY